MRMCVNQVVNIELFRIRVGTIRNNITQ